MKFTLLAVFIIIIAFNFSCTSYKQVPYFQDLNRNSVVSETIENFSPLTMQPGDLLDINVTSMNHEADLIYNHNVEYQGSLSTDKIPASASIGYLINPKGFINLPTIGAVKVSELTTSEISKLLELKLQTYLSNPIVNVRILNFKISVLGDVKSPGSFNIQNEKVTITEALSLAGDLNVTGLRKNVLLIREREGNRDYVNLDLTAKNVIHSQYYYLKNNDVLYIQPNRAKISNDNGPFIKLAAVLSTVSLIVYLFKR